MRKEFVFLCIALFLLLFGTYLSGSLLVPYAKTLGGTGTTIGIIYSCMYVVRLVFGSPIGRLSERKGSKAILTYSLMLFPIIAAVYWFSWNIASLLGARFLHGFASAMLLPMAMAYMGEISPKGQEGRYMGIYNTILFVAAAIGPLVGGFIYDRFGIRYAFFSLFILAVIALIIVLIASRNTEKPVVKEEASNPYMSNTYETVYTTFGINKPLIMLSILNVLISVFLALFGASFTMLGLYRGFNMLQIGLLVAINNIILGATQIPLGHFVDRMDKFKLTIYFGILTAALLLLLPSADKLWIFVILIIAIGIASAVCLASTSALSALLGRNLGMGKTMGFIGSVNSAGTIAGYLLLGVLTDKFSIGVPFYFTSTLWFLVLLFLMYYNRNKKLGLSL